MKRLLGYIVVLAILMLLLCGTCYAATKSGLYTYEIKGNGNAKITGFDWKNNSENNIYIPRMIDGYTITEIGEFAFSDKNAEYDKRVGSEVVVRIPDTITVIGEKAFFCTNITQVNIPSSVQILGTGAFAGCWNLSEFIVDNGNSVFTTIDGVLYKKTTKELVNFPMNKSLESYTAEKPLTIPNGIRVIGDYAFYGYKYIYQSSRSILPISLPDTIERIGKYAFANACFLRDRMPEELRTIDDYAFYNCRLSYISKFGTDADYLQLSDKLEYIGRSAFEKSAFVTKHGSIVLPASVSYIGDYAFSSIVGEYWGLKWWPMCVYDGHFGGSRLLTIDISKTKVQHIHEGTFSLNLLTEVKLPDVCEDIGEYAFANCLLGEITIPKNVRQIDNFAFFRSAIGQFGKPKTIESDVLSFWRSDSVSFKAWVELADVKSEYQKYRDTFYRNENPKMTSGNLTFDSDSCLLEIGESAFEGMIIFGKNDFELDIPDGTQTIGSKAFYDVVGMTTLSLPASITSIGGDQCSFSDVAIKAMPGTYSAVWATENGYVVKTEDDLSWLD